MKSRSTAMHYLKATVEDIDSAIKKYGPLKNSTHFREMFESELRRFNNG